MADNRITIGKGKEKKDEFQQKEDQRHQELKPERKSPLSLRYRQEMLVEQLWGNERELDQKLDKDVLTEKRHYVRVRYVQRVVCNLLSPGQDLDPEVLEEPIFFTIFDISMGGIGAVCSDNIKKGAILSFGMKLDETEYAVDCQVIYCIPIEDMYRVGLKVLMRDKTFVTHLKIIIARKSLESML